MVTEGTLMDLCHDAAKTVRGRDHGKYARQLRGYVGETSQKRGKQK